MRKQTMNLMSKAVMLAAVTGFVSARGIAADVAPAPEKKIVIGKKVWTNDDFPAADAPAAPEKADAQPAPAPKPAVEVAAVPQAELSPDLQKARQDIAAEMLATAKAREKAYDDTINDVKAKLETETNEFRIEVYNNILRDTTALKEVNKHVFEQFGEKSPAKPEADKQPADKQ